MKKPHRTSLRLDRETVRVLSTTEIRVVVGGNYTFHCPTNDGAGASSCPDPPPEVL